MQTNYYMLDLMDDQIEQNEPHESWCLAVKRSTCCLQNHKYQEQHTQILQGFFEQPQQPVQQAQFLPNLMASILPSHYLTSFHHT